jgi:hypothetical protein
MLTNITFSHLPLKDDNEYVMIDQRLCKDQLKQVADQGHINFIILCIPPI